MNCVSFRFGLLVALISRVYLPTYCSPLTSVYGRGDTNGSDVTVFEGRVQSLKWWVCLDELEYKYKYWMLGFIPVNYYKQSQKWALKQNGQLVHPMSGYCVSYYQDWNNLNLVECNQTDPFQFWRLSNNHTRFFQFINKGVSQQKNSNYCMVQDTQYAKLVPCDASMESQFFTFVLQPPPPPPSPSPPPPSPPQPPSPPFPSISINSPVCSKEYNKCLDFKYMHYEKQMLGFVECNIQDETEKDNSQEWQFMSNGWIMQNSSGLCVSYYAPWQNLMLANCSWTDNYQFWKQEQCENGQYYQYKNLGYSQIWHKDYCMFAKSSSLFDIFAELKSCSDSDVCEIFQEKLFGFFSCDNPPPSPSPSYDGGSTINVGMVAIGVVMAVLAIGGVGTAVSVCCASKQRQQGVERQSLIQQSNDNFDDNQQRSNDNEQLPLHRWNTTIIQDSLISQIFTGGESEVICCICLENMREGQEETILPCAHQFHKTCFEQWLQTQRRNVTCPLCNLHLLSHQTLQQSDTQ